MTWSFHPPYLLNKMLGGRQSWFGSGELQKSYCSGQESRPRLSSPVAVPGCNVNGHSCWNSANIILGIEVQKSAWITVLELINCHIVRMRKETSGSCGSPQPHPSLFLQTDTCITELWTECIHTSFLLHRLLAPQMFLLLVKNCYFHTDLAHSICHST